MSIYGIGISLSGGADNVLPANCLGGVMSSKKVLSQSVSALLNVTGVAVDYAHSNEIGLGTIESQPSGSATTQVSRLALNWGGNNSGGSLTVSVDINGVTYSYNGTTSGYLVSPALQGLSDVINADTSINTILIASAINPEATEADAYIDLTAINSGSSGVFSVENLNTIYSSDTHTMTLSSIAFGGDAHGPRLRWKDNADAFGQWVDINADGNYRIESSTLGVLETTITINDMPASAQSDDLSIDYIANETFPDWIASDVLNGAEQYACFYLHNESQQPRNVKLWIESQPTGDDTLEIGFDAAAINVDAGVIANSYTAPIGAIFSAPANKLTSISVVLPVGEKQAFWQKRSIVGGETGGCYSR